MQYKGYVQILQRKYVLFWILYAKTCFYFIFYTNFLYNNENIFSLQYLQNPILNCTGYIQNIKQKHVFTYKINNENMFLFYILFATLVLQQKYAFVVDFACNYTIETCFHAKDIFGKKQPFRRIIDNNFGVNSNSLYNINGIFQRLIDYTVHVHHHQPNLQTIL